MSIYIDPLFILCYGFQSTKQLASKWLYYGIGTLFSMALLSFMVALVTKIVVAVGLMMIAKYAILVTLQGSQALEGINTMAMQQGGIGLIMTVLLISCPPLAAQFFNATIGQISAYNAFSQSGQQARDANGNPLGGGSNRMAYQANDDIHQRGDGSVQTTVYNGNIRTPINQQAPQGDKIKTEEEARNRRP